MTTVRKIIEVLERETEENTIPWRPDHKEQNVGMCTWKTPKFPSAGKELSGSTARTPASFSSKRDGANPLCQMLYDRIPLRKAPDHGRGGERGVETPEQVHPRQGG